MVAFALLQVSTLMACLFVVFDRVARPRLPEYHIHVVGLPMPKRSARTNEWRIAIQTDVDFFNANFFHIDVHALSFDLFYATGPILSHIGNVQDLQQHERISKSRYAAESSQHDPRQQSKPKQRRAKRTRSTKNNTEAPAPVLWSIESRSSFTASTTMMTSLNFWDLLRSLYQLLCRWWQNSGNLTVPMAGVAHIRAVTLYGQKSDSHKSKTTAVSTMTKKPSSSTRSSHPLALKVPFTVSIICDSLVETWRWQTKITGVECSLHNLVPGWTDLEKTAATVRDFALQRLPVNATGGVLNHPTLSWEEVLETIAWEESLQHP